jgi:transposase
VSRYVGIDLHRRRSQVVILDGDGVKRSSVRVENSPGALVEAVAAAGEAPEVVLEATWGWYWAADVLAEAGCRVRLAHPLGVKGYQNRRVKNDERDATLLADLLRMGSLPEGWIAPAPLRELRESVRYRHKLSRLRTGLKSQIHAVLGKEGVIPTLTGLWGPAGARWLDDVELGDAYRQRIESLRRFISRYDTEIARFDARIHRLLRDDAGYRVIQQLDGVGPVIAAVFVTEIGDVSRFESPKRLCSWAGLTPRHRESDTKVIRGSITKQGAPLVRWAAIEAVARYRGGAPIRDTYRRIAQRKGNKIARVAAARKLLTLVYYGLRDHQIRCLNKGGVNGSGTAPAASSPNGMTPPHGAGRDM